MKNNAKTKNAVNEAWRKIHIFNTYLQFTDC